MSDSDGALRHISVSRQGKCGSCLILVQLQSRYLSAVHATRADMLVRGVLLQISVSMPDRGGSCLMLVRLQSRHLSTLHAVSAEMSDSPALLLQSMCSNHVNAIKGVTSSTQMREIHRRLLHVARGDKSATWRPLK